MEGKRIRTFRNRHVCLFSVVLNHGGLMSLAWEALDVGKRTVFTVSYISLGIHLDIRTLFRTSLSVFIQLAPNLVAVN